MTGGYVRRYYHPYIMLLYVWVYLLSAWLVHVTIIAELRFDPLRVMPLVHAGLAVMFLLVIMLRVPVLDLWRGMNLREHFGYFLICATFFLAPVIISHRVNWLICFVTLQFPLILTMVDRAGFVRVQANLLVLLTGWCLCNHADPHGSLLGCAFALFVCCNCFSLDYRAFRYEQLEQSGLHPLDDWRGWLRRIAQTHWIALQFYLCAGALTLWLFWLTPLPALPPVFLEPALDEATQIVRYQQRTISAQDITSIAYHTGGLLLLVLVLLVIAYYLRRLQFGKPRIGEREINIGAASAAVERITRERQAKKLPEPRTPREALLRHYFQFCDNIAAKTRPRQESETAAEYRNALNTLLPNAAAPLEQITNEFEQAKYSPASHTWEQVKKYQQLLKDCAQQFFHQPK